MSGLVDRLNKCMQCPHSCSVDRLHGERGKCRLDASLLICQASLHFGEESVLVGRGGSGTIFFSSCNLSCVFCQNYDISQLDTGRTVNAKELHRMMMGLQNQGAENINLVSPTHQSAQIFDVIRESKKQGLNLPVVYNCGGYENAEWLRELDGLVDIYMPDFKYGDNAAALEYSGCKEYFEHCSQSLLEMQRQAGSLKMNERGVAYRGLLIRHLVLPFQQAGSFKVIDFITDNLPLDTYVNIMDQYRPCYHAAEYEKLSRRVFAYEVEEVVLYAKKKGLLRVLY
ncbi:MAG: 4Fe-4S cluster-binding domain-containing protein [Spirochaetales bacterium]|nr:4Fe-4S cluster-binding domain-containing protein [Spirochaetales bacterium]